MFERFRSEIGEQLRVPVYSGDTQQNFRTAAVYDHKNTVYYDKSKLPQWAHRELFVAKTETAFSFHRSLMKSRELNHSPLIVEGGLSRFSSDARNKSDWIEFPAGFLLPVAAVWIPSDDIAWREINPLAPLPDFREIFQRMDPNEFLNLPANPLI